MLVKDVMTPSALTVDMETTIFQAAMLMRDHNVGFLPIVAEHVCAGVLTDRDIVVRVVAENRDPRTTTAAMVMSRGVPRRDQPELGGTSSIAALSEDADIEEALDLMEKLEVQRLAVYDREERIVGVVSRRDLPIAHAIV